MNDEVQYPNMTHAEDANRKSAFGPGMLLRQARERLKKTPDDIARELHLKVDTVLALENELYDQLPSLIYVRGYIRAYARYVNFPEEKVLKSFNDLGMKDKPSDAPRLLPQNRGLQDSSVKWVGYLFFFALAVFLLLWWHNHTINNADGDSVAPVVKNTASSQRVQSQRQQTVSANSTTSATDFDDQANSYDAYQQGYSDTALDRVLDHIDEFGSGE